jgi:integrase
MATESRRTREPLLLTAKTIEALKPDPAGAYYQPDLRCAGLALRVAANGGKTWGLAYRIKGAGVRRHSFGRYEDFGLERARQRANDLTSAARQGDDLIAEEEAARNEYNQSFTVEQLIGEYAQRRLTGRLRTANKVERRLKRALASLMNRKAADIQRRDLRRLLDKVADQGLKREVGHRKQAVGALFKWALAQDIIATNPADGLASYAGSKPRDRVLKENEISQLWQWLDDRKNIASEIGDILKLQLCLGARCGEIGGIRASEFTTDGKDRLLWTLPAERSKNKRSRVTPILGLAKDIIASRISDEIMFPYSSGEPFHSALVGQHLRQRWDRLPIARFSTHDLRRTAATMMVSQLSLPLELVAAVVGHTSGSSQTQTLVRHYIHDDFVDRKATALAQWDRRLRTILTGEDGKVIPLRA